MYEKTYPHKRFQTTISFLKKHLANQNATILDLGIDNPMAKIMKDHGFRVINTNGEDLDEDISVLTNSDYDIVTAFEIFEHLLNPYTVLKNIKANKIFISVPLKLWFSNAYRNPNDARDQHFHEFESWQLDWLLQKTGFVIKDRIKFTHPVKKIGIRPLLRLFVPRYYLIYAERSI